MDLCTALDPTAVRWVNITARTRKLRWDHKVVRTHLIDSTQIAIAGVMRIVYIGFLIGFASRMSLLSSNKH